MSPIKKIVDCPISQLCTFQHEGVVPVVYDVDSVEELSGLVQTQSPFVVLGKGSNTLIDPKGDFGAIVRLSPSMFDPSFSNGLLQVGAGVNVASLMNLSKRFECTGLEFAAGVPATVGGMVAMNFGCWGLEMKDVIHRVLALDECGKSVWLSASECEFAYRRSVFQRRQLIVLMAEFTLKSAPLEQIKSLILSNINTRLEKQPLRAKSKLTHGSCVTSTT